MSLQRKPTSESLQNRDQQPNFADLRTVVLTARLEAIDKVLLLSILESDPTGHDLSAPTTWLAACISRSYRQVQRRIDALERRRILIKLSDANTNRRRTCTYMLNRHALIENPAFRHVPNPDADWIAEHWSR
jgi:hypothetical protein